MHLDHTSPLRNEIVRRLSGSLSVEANDESTQSIEDIRSLINTSRTLLNNSIETSPLASMVLSQRTLLEELAQSWHAFGASSLGVRGTRLLYYWTEATEERQQTPLTVPLVANGSTIGTLEIGGLPQPEDITLQTRMHADAALLTQLTVLTTDLNRARAELIEREGIKTELDLAASIQIHLLPQTFPLTRGLDIYAYCQPARQVGGDFYNFNVQENRPFIFAVGDVSGKGLPAAMLMAMTRIVLHGAARFMPVIHPHAILSRINEDLYDDFTELGMFATVFVGCYDATKQELSYANAGHSPVIYCPAGGSALLLEADGPAIGVLPINLSENITIPFQKHDVLVVATDGLSEATNIEGDMFGYERLLRLVEELAELPAEEIAAKLFQQIKSFTQGANQSDDQTLIIVKGVEV